MVESKHQKSSGNYTNRSTFGLGIEQRKV
jgi:hypothetical protein